MPRYTSLYEVRATGRSHCELVVVNASISHAGRYVCYANSIESEEVSLSVLATNVTGSQTSDVAVGGDVVNYTCQISFYSNTHWSFLSWSTAVQSRVSSSTNTDTIDLYISSIMVKIPEGPATVNRTCYVNYGALSSDYFWQSAVIDVSYCPKNVEIVGARSSSTVAEGTVLTCAGEAHPPPSYQWTDAVSNSTVEGDTFVVAAMKYHSLTCTVTTNVTFANGTTETCGSSVHFEVKGNSAESVKTCHSFPLWIAVIATAHSLHDIVVSRGANALFV